MFTEDLLIDAISSTEESLSPLKQRARIIKADYILNNEHSGKIKGLSEEIVQRTRDGKDKEEHIKALTLKIEHLADRAEKAKKQAEAQVV